MISRRSHALAVALAPWIWIACAFPATGADPSNTTTNTDAHLASLVTIAAPKVTEKDGIWRIEGRRQVIQLNTATLALEVTSPGARWRMTASEPGDLQARVRGTPVSLQLSRADSIQVSPYATGYSTGVQVVLGKYHPDAETEALDLELRLFITLDGQEEDLVCEILASDRETTVDQLRWPGPVIADDFDHTVIPFMQGILLPRAWPGDVRLYDSLCFGRGLYQPWWGHQQRNQALLVILETPDDAGCHFAHPSGGPTRIGPRWVSSLQRWAYPRRARLCFVEGNYVTLAKRYRRHAMEQGRFVSLREKIARNPRVADLIGAPVIHTSILYHIQPDSSYFNRTNPAANHQWVSFDARAAELRAMPGRGVPKAYVHLDGWGVRGYDNLHPDVLPPCPEAGGWDGMRRLADACVELGFVFAIHDQYRDYYLDAASYHERHTLIEGDGRRPLHATWYGGRQSILCQRLAPGFVRRNHRALLDQGIRLQGAYLDVFSVVPPDECHSPEHPVTRSQSLRFRAECLDSVRSWGGVVSSEEPSDWSVPHLDLVHHGPYPLHPNPGGGPALGIPVPLFNLVYHDALLIPWSLGRGAWGIPQTDLGFLHGLGNAGLPYVSLSPDASELRQVRALQALHQRVGLLEQTAHRFLDPHHRRQEFDYADGTRVSIDLDADTWQVTPALPESSVP